ncbi:MAG: 14-3-3 protein [Amphiamblys sp. WSBS2006]|nr:MAG: 14-3-3 protein [Amphiamblys sp. WSBS2006]
MEINASSLEQVEDIMYYAKLSDQTERYGETIMLVHKLVDKIKETGMRELTHEERNLLSAGYKNSVNSKRSAWRMLQSLEKKQDSQCERKKELLSAYKAGVQKELQDVCFDALNLIQNTVLPVTQRRDDQVSYNKMCGDYYRYIAEVSVGEMREKAVSDALSVYQRAVAISEASMDTTHPTRLGLSLNFSVFYYEIMNDEDKACEIARTAFEGAIDKLETIEEESYRDSTLIMQLLRDNLTLWTSEAK